MKSNFNINLSKKLIYLYIALLYFSIHIGFFFDEDFIGGAKADFITYKNWINLFLTDFNYYFFNYDELDERHSPIIIFYFTILNKLGISEEIIRYVHINISFLIFFAFFQCLKLKYKKFNKSILILFASLVFFSPTLRALSIWPDSRIYGLFFFVLSIYYFLKFEENKKLLNAYLNIITLAIASYISPNFSVFSIFFFYKFFLYYQFNYKLLEIIILNIFLAIPAFYYLFYLDIMFLFEGGTPGDQTLQGKIPNRFNFANKILLISTIIFFYLIPFLITGIVKIKKITFKDYLIASIILIPCVLLFNYMPTYTGGGIFFHISYKILNTNIFLYLIFYLSLLIILKICTKNITNIVIISLLLLSNIQLTVYHKYYDPLLLILFLTIFDFKNFSLNINKYLIFLIYNVIFLGISIIF